MKTITSSCANTQRRKNNHSGQIATEYAIMLFAALFVTAALLVLFKALSEYGWGVVAAVAVDYP